MQYEFLPQNEQQVSINEKKCTPQEITSIALLEDSVMSARCFEYQNKYILSLILKPFFLKSEKDKYVDNLTKNLIEKAQKDVIITLDIDIFCKIDDTMTDDKKQFLYEKITQRT